MIRPPRRRLVALSWVAATALAVLAGAQPGIDDALLMRKRMFAEQQLEALRQPFVGVRASAGVQTGLFPIRATGVSTAPIVQAAQALLATLTPAQLIRTVFAVEDAEWRRWSNVDNGLYTRQGVSLREMSDTQRDAAMALLRASLSARGLTQALDIMKTDQVLREVNDDALRYDERLYFLTVMGRPSATEPWGWQVDGHHLVINYAVLGDQVVMTPVFMGGEPVVASSGRYAGNSVLQGEQNDGLAFMRALSPAQQRTATLRRDKPGNDIQAQADRDNHVLDYAGVKASTLSAPLKAQLLALIGRYVGHLRDDHAAVRMRDVAAHLDDTRFAWAGDVTDDAVFYYRIHSPVVLIEFDHQLPVGTRPLYPADRPTRAHIHTMVRTPNGNDYGKDWLRQHLATHPH
jgi:Protein of unknown function (DUF3500)